MTTLTKWHQHFIKESKIMRADRETIFQLNYLFSPSWGERRNHRLDPKQVEEKSSLSRGQRGFIKEGQRNLRRWCQDKERNSLFLWRRSDFVSQRRERERVWGRGRGVFGEKESDRNKLMVAIGGARSNGLGWEGCELARPRRVSGCGRDGCTKKWGLPGVRSENGKGTREIMSALI
jgi:hypothetical protein